MKRSLSILIVLIFISFLSGCILSKTPSTNDVTMNLGDKMTFSVNIFPFNSTYTWTLDGAALSNTGKTYVYTAEAGKHTLTVKAKHICGTDIQTWNVYGNRPPVSNAGPDQTVDFGATVTLDGSGSTDPDLNIVSYKWKQTDGPTVTLNNADTDKAMFTDSVAGGSVLTFELTVTDAGGLTSTDTCNVYGNSPPVSNAGPDQTVDFGATVTLDGSGSTDPDLNIVSYKWKQTDGPTVTLNNADTDKAKFTASVAGDSVLTFELTVTDAGGLTSTDTCKVSVSYIMFNKNFGGISNDYAYAMQLTSDGGYILAGYTSSYGAGGNYAWLIKTDAYGNKVWDKIFEGDTANAVQQTSDGGYILAGRTYSFGAGNYDAWLIKTDENGIKDWDKTFGGSDYDQANAVQQTSDGGYILAGWTESSGAGYADTWLIKTDENGNEVWDKTFGGSGWEEANAVQQTSDGGYILAGRTYSFGAGNYDAWLIKTDENGIKDWDKTFGGSGGDWARAVMQTSDGGYILAGWTESFGVGNFDAWLIKTDENGIKDWDRTFGGSVYDQANAVQQTSDGGYILAGYTLSYGAGDAWLIKTFADGNKDWDKTFGGSSSDWACALQLTSDGGYILAGYTSSYGAGGNDAWLIKTDADGNASATPTP